MYFVCFSGYDFRLELSLFVVGLEKGIDRSLAGKDVGVKEGEILGQVDSESQFFVGWFDRGGHHDVFLVSHARLLRDFDGFICWMCALDTGFEVALDFSGIFTVGIVKTKPLVK